MNRKEFKIVFDNHFSEIRRYVFYRSGNEETANDVAQEVFIKLWEKRAKIEIKTVRALLYKIASDLFISTYRKEKKDFEFFKHFIPAESNASADDNVHFEELKKQYEQALKTMPENQRMVFLLNRVDELTYPEIAERLGLSVKAIEKRMSLALKYLKENLKTHYKAFINLMIVYRERE